MKCMSKLTLSVNYLFFRINCEKKRMYSLYRSKEHIDVVFSVSLILEVLFLGKILKVNPVSRAGVQRFQTSYRPLWHPLSGCMKKMKY